MITINWEVNPRMVKKALKTRAKRIENGMVFKTFKDGKTELVNPDEGCLYFNVAEKSLGKCLDWIFKFHRKNGIAMFVDLENDSVISIPNSDITRAGKRVLKEKGFRLKKGVYYFTPDKPAQKRKPKPEQEIEVPMKNRSPEHVSLLLSRLFLKASREGTMRLTYDSVKRMFKMRKKVSDDLLEETAAYMNSEFNIAMFSAAEKEEEMIFFIHRDFYKKFKKAPARTVEKFIDI